MTMLKEFQTSVAEMGETLQAMGSSTTKALQDSDNEKVYVKVNSYQGLTGVC